MVKKPMDILIVDDERDFVEMLSLRLIDEGHRVRGAYNGEAGLAALNQAEADVVILDLKMPGMDGIQTMREIKARYPKVEVILLTAAGTSFEELKPEAFDYLVKPAKYEDLIIKLEAARLSKDRR